MTRTWQPGRIISGSVVQVSWVPNRVIEIWGCKEGALKAEKFRACQLKVDLGLSLQYLSEMSTSLPGIKVIQHCRS